MTQKLLSSIKNLFGEHSGVMILCLLLMLGTFWSIADSVIESDGAGIIGLVLTIAACLGTCFLLHRSMEHGEEGSDEKKL